MLGFDFHVDGLALFFENFLQVGEFYFALADFGDENHVEEAVHDVLIDAEYIHVVLGENTSHHGNDAHPIPAYHRYYQFHFAVSLGKFFRGRRSREFNVPIITISQ